MSDRLYAVSPLDGRYADRTEPLVQYTSEAALMRARVRIEAEYVIALSRLDELPFDLDETMIEAVRRIYEEFDRSDAEFIKQLEMQGTESYPATNHDVKAVEYFLRERVPDEISIDHWLHFGLTSEDVNNLAYRILIKDAVRDVLRPAIESIRGKLAVMAEEYRALPMLSRTHGQPATPTTFGKELAVYAHRLERGLGRIDNAVEHLGGKLAGASGTYAAHTIGEPSVDWRAFSRSFVDALGLEPLPLVTQVNPGDDLAVLFDALAGSNSVLIDLNRDMWLYISQDYLGQEAATHETGSSTMPHKVNPIDFENSEGNLEKATADFRFLADSLTTSRLQRDLSDSTVKRTIGGSLAHCLIGYSKLSDGLGTVIPNEAAMRADLADNPSILAEAIQSVLRREGRPDAYEQVKEITRGREVTLEELHEFVHGLGISEEARERLLSLTPETYTGIADELVEELVEDSG